MSLLRLEIVTPDQVVLDTQADYVGAPGVDGEFGVLPGHIPLLTALQIGILYYRRDNKEYRVFVSGGFAEVADNKITILAQSSELAENVDIERAKHSKERAEKRIAVRELASKEKDDLDFIRAEFALQRALMRIKLKVS